MSKTMTKYQLDHFRDKVKRQFNPMIQDQELLVKQFIFAFTVIMIYGRCSLTRWSWYFAP